MRKDEITVQVPRDRVREIVDQHIRVAIINALSENPEEVIGQVVDAALSEKSDKHYGSRETKFETCVKKMIQDAAGVAFGDWVEQNKQAITDAVLARLSGKTAGFVDRAADALVKGLSENLSVRVELPTAGDW